MFLRLLLQQMDWRDSLYGYIGMQDHTSRPDHSSWIFRANRFSAENGPASELA